MVAPKQIPLTKTVTVPINAIHAAQETPSGLVIMAGGDTTLVDPALETSVRNALGFSPVRPFMRDDPKMPMAKYNNPDIDAPPLLMPAGNSPPLHMPGTPMNDDVKKRLGLL